MMLEINKYNIKLEYLPGSKRKIADALSRNFLIENADDNNDDQQYLDEI